MLISYGSHNSNCNCLKNSFVAIFNTWDCLSFLRHNRAWAKSIRGPTGCVWPCANLPVVQCRGLLRHYKIIPQIWVPRHCCCDLVLSQAGMSWGFFFWQVMTRPRCPHNDNLAPFPRHITDDRRVYCVIYIYIYIYIYICIVLYIYIYIYMCVCVCVCALSYKYMYI